MQATKQLWSEAHSALCAGRWATAYAAVDALNYRNDNVDTLCELEAYERAAGSPAPSPLREELKVRLGLVNANVRRPRIRRAG